MGYRFGMFCPANTYILELPPPLRCRRTWGQFRYTFIVYPALKTFVLSVKGCENLKFIGFSRHCISPRVTCCFERRISQESSEKHHLAPGTNFNMTVLTPSPSPSALLSTTSSTDIIKLLSPALTHSLYFAAVFQRLLSTTTFFLFLRAYASSLFILRQAFYASQLLLIQSYYASVLLARQVYPVVKLGMKRGWKATEKFRKKLFFEFIVFVLGAGGNQILLIVFWPGWIVLSGGAMGIWWACC